MPHLTKLEQLVEIGRAFEQSGRWAEVKIDGTGTEPRLIVKGSTAQRGRAAFTDGRMTLTGLPWRKNDA